MNCPNCSHSMDCEQAPEVKSSSWQHFRRTGRETMSIPTAMYYCSGCDSEWVWRRGERILQIDGADFDNNSWQKNRGRV